MASPTRLIVPVIALGVLAGCLFVLLRRPRPPVPASAVVAQIREIVLRRAEEDGEEDGGPVGPWWVAAEGVDEDSGRLVNFRLTGGAVRVAAKSARLVVDPATDSFSFELDDVVLTRLPAEESGGEASVRTLDHHVLGPIPCGKDIVSDAVEALVSAE